jgi:multidrug efflux pump subunit AcrA (membrane-fusion protein)
MAAHVIKIVPTADRTKATVRVRIGFDKLEPRILPDMSIKVRFLDDQPAPVANSGPRIHVPSAAVQRVNGEAYVWLVNGGRVERRAITVGAENDGQAEVLAGVKAGDELVAPIVEGLKDGGKIKLKESNS